MREISFNFADATRAYAQGESSTLGYDVNPEQAEDNKNTNNNKGEEKQ